MAGKQVITLTTDFGYNDPFVGVMKGVILKINPEAKIVDLTHGIRPGDIQEAAFTIGMNCHYFPEETLHVVVVDPGVGSRRRPILMLSNHHYFLGPDNGVFSYISRVKHETLEVVHITAEHYFLQKKSPTFQGRDLFAPIAGWFSRGVAMEKFGDPITDYQMINLPFPEVTAEGKIRGKIIHIDGFGNAISNITKKDIESLAGKGQNGPFRVFLKEEEIAVKDFYCEGHDNRLFALVNSSGYIEFFVCAGHAASGYQISIGDEVEIGLSEQTA